MLSGGDKDVGKGQIFLDLQDILRSLNSSLTLKKKKSLWTRRMTWSFFFPREVIKAGIKENKLEKNKTRGRDH